MQANDPEEELHNKKEQVLNMLETKRLYPEYSEYERRNINNLLNERDIIMEYYVNNIGNENRAVQENCIDNIMHNSERIKKWLGL